MTCINFTSLIISILLWCVFDVTGNRNNTTTTMKTTPKITVPMTIGNTTVMKSTTTMKTPTTIDTSTKIRTTSTMKTTTTMKTTSTMKKTTTMKTTTMMTTSTVATTTGFYRCSPDWHNYHNELCYKFFESNSTYTEAAENCRSVGADLVSINTIGQLYLVTSFVPVSKFRGYWIGLSDRRRRGKFLWENNTPLTVINWSPNSGYLYPASGHSSTCVFLESRDEPDHGKWKPGQCRLKMGYACERPLHSVFMRPPPPRGCPHGTIAWRWGCYWFMNYTKTFSDAKNRCLRGRGYPVWFENTAEMNFVKSLISQTNNSYWIGLQRLGKLNKFTWYHARTMKMPVSHLHLSATTGLNEGKCVSVGPGKHNVKFSLNNCVNKMGMLCKKRRTGVTALTQRPNLICPYSGWTEAYGTSDKCYKAFYIKRTWKNAKKTCESFGGELIKFTDSQFYTTVSRRLNRYSKYWIGLNFLENPTVGKWTDGSLVTYTKWKSSSTARQKRCVYMMYPYSSSRRGWYTDLCLQMHQFICTVDKGSSTRPTPTSVSYPALIPCEHEGPKWYSYNGFCYYISKDRSDQMTWTDARTFCGNHGGDLVSIHSLIEAEFITQMIRKVISAYGTNSIWIGFNALHRYENYRWSDGSAINFVHWKSGEPSDDYHQQKCAAVLSSTGEWSDYNCQYKKYFICKKVSGATANTATYPTPPPSFTGYCPIGWKGFKDKCYKLRTGKRSWTSAERSCRSMGPGHDLAVIHDEDVQRFLMKYVGEFNSDVWIGLNDKIYERTFTWSDNFPVVYTAWAKFEPRSRIGDCVSMKKGIADGGKWMVTSCYRSLYYLCQRYKDPTLTESPEVPKKCKGHKMFAKYREKCYKVMDTRSGTFDEAAADCQRYGGNLASINDIYDQTFVNDLTKMSNKSFWIGMTKDVAKEEAFYWINKWPVQFTYWSDMEPKLVGNRARCALMYPGSGKWKAEDCRESRSYICEIDDEPVPSMITNVEGFCPSRDWIDVGDENCYMLVTTKRTWPEASFHCKAQDGVLVSFHSTSVIANVMRHFRRRLTTTLAWIGLYKTDSKLKWVDNSPMQLVNFDSKYKIGLCVSINVTSFKWRTTRCSSIYPFICMINKNTTYQPGQPSQIKHSIDSDSSLSSGQAVMIGLGCVAAICFVAAVYIYYRRRKQTGHTNASRSFTFDNEMYETN